MQLFLKSQRVKKLGAAYSDAKKGQTVTNLSHAQLFHDQVWATYLEIVLFRSLRPEVYLHSGKNFDQMSAHYDRYWDKSKPVTACDYTGWDSGVDESFSLFYHDLMISYGIPPSVAEKFLYDRHHRRSFLGAIRPMQASGDRYTWLLNTVGNMALTGLSFNTPPKTPACFSGDDMILCGDFSYIPQPQFTFIDKVIHERGSEFCGYMYGAPKLHVSPRVLVHRGLMGLEDGRGDEAFWDSFERTILYSQSGFDSYDSLLAYALQINQVARSIFHLSAPHPRLPYVPISPRPPSSILHYPSLDLFYEQAIIPRRHNGSRRSKGSRLIPPSEHVYFASLTLPSLPV
jgi:hypothetical protein